MDDRANLGLWEFLDDLRLVMVSPARRFPVIHERGALWGSLTLLLVPAYFAFHFVGGIYFERDPIPGYSWILPAAPALLLTFLKLYLIHAFARVLQPKGGRTGTVRELVSVFGYTSVPSILAMILALLFFLAMPERIGSLFRSFRIVFMSTLVAVSVALFIWNLILTVLAMRTTYNLRDFKIVAAFLLGSIALGLPATVAVHMVVGSEKVDLAYVRPYLRENIVRFFAADPISPLDSETKITVEVDRVAYRLRQPQRFELVVFFAADPESLEGGSRGGAVTVGRQPVISYSEGAPIVGRIVGMPGENVALVGGELRINGRAWVEPYIAPEFQSSFSLAQRQLGPSEYLVLSGDRRLLQSMAGELVIDEGRIMGRMIAGNYPLGWLWFRPTLFLKGHPEP